MKLDIETVYRNYSDYIFNYIYGMVQNKAEAEDLLQDTFMKVVKSRNKDIEDVKAWLITIARNTVYDHWRTRKKKVQLNPFMRSKEKRDIELKLDIEREINKLTPKLKEVIVLREINQLDYKEIADIVDVSIGTVKSRLSRARKQLRESLGGKL